MDHLLDFRSDTVTRPDAAMKAAMLEAETGDDVYGEDPTVNRLEETVAALLGKEAALFVPSGTMANQIALHLHCRPGDSVVCEERSHVFLYEAGGAAANTGVQFSFVPLSAGLQPDAVAAACLPEDLHQATSTLLSLENTHNMGGGRPLPAETIHGAAAVARERGMAVHCDGARLWNAACAWNTEPAALVAPCDTVAVCLSKGLGAPVGSLLAGTAGLMTRARKIRKRWGGGMRQAGILAAAGLVALEQQLPRLAADHEGAATFVRALENRCRIEYPRPGTNIVCVTLPGQPGDDTVRLLHEQGILLHHLGGDRLRLVWHRDIPPDGTDRLISAFEKLCR